MMAMTSTKLNRDERRVAFAFAAISLLVAALVLAVPYIGDADADPDDGYKGEADYYSIKVKFALTDIDQVNSVIWDFGDGSPTETVELTPENPTGMTSDYHVFPKVGDYRITATLLNRYVDPADGVEKDGKTVIWFMAHVLGYPTITFDPQGGSDVASITQNKVSYVATKPADPTRSGWDFGGWYTDKECTLPFDWSSEVSKHITLYAKWTEIPGKTYWTITYDADGGVCKASDSVADGESFELPKAEKDGCAFDGWYLGEELFGQAGDSKTVSSDVTLKAHWKEVADDDRGFDLLLVIFIVLTVVFVLAYIFNGHYGFIAGAAVCGIVAVLIFLGVI